MTFMEFGSIEEMQTFLAEREQEANDNLLDFQRNIGWGAYFIRLWEDTYAPGGDPLLIVGDIWTREHADTSNRELGADEEEARYADEMLANAHERGYRFGKCYSTIEPDGELGSTHVADIWCEITAEQFEDCRRFGWDPYRLMEDTAWFAEKMREPGQ
jgi:hypothetical protein